MLLVRHVNDMSESERGSVIALGNFDGFHRGHQVVVGEAGRIARKEGCPLALFTTEPHPRSYFSPDSGSYRLTPFRERSRLFEHFGIDILFVLAFDDELAGTTASDFVGQVLARDLGVSRIVVGHDYRFGKGREGTAAMLQALAGEVGIGVTVVSPVGAEGEGAIQYSSTMVRKALQSGDVRQAASILGHWWSVNGRVIEGEKRGRQIGFPTANVALGDSLVPALGVYAVRVSFDGEGAKTYDGVANIGTRPTFDGEGVLLEAHVFDLDEGLYDRHARVELIEFIRAEKKFDGLDALKAQIAEDCEAARAVLAEHASAHVGQTLPSLDAYLAGTSA